MVPGREMFFSVELKDGRVQIARGERTTQFNHNHSMANKPDKDMFQPLIEAETNGENYDISTEDIIARLKEWQGLCEFTLGEVDSSTVELKFETLPEDLDEFLAEAYELCPDLVADDLEEELPLLKKQLAKN